MMAPSVCPARGGHPGRPRACPQPLPLDVAALTGRSYLSYTQVTTFQRCPLKWHFQYVEGRAHERVGASLAFGSAIHAAIETHFRALLAGLPHPNLFELLAVYDTAWQAETAVPVQFGKGEYLSSLRELARRVLGAFLTSPAVEPGGEILGVEEELRRQVIAGLPELLAWVDLLVKTDDALVVRDFKTSRSRWSAANVTESAPQLLLYGELATPLAEAFGDLPIRLEFVVLTKAKQPTVETHVVDLDSRTVERTKRIIARVWQAMQTGHVYPNPSALNCSTCPLQQACRAWRG
jgi:putative RecB family exonuclease